MEKTFFLSNQNGDAIQLFFFLTFVWKKDKIIEEDSLRRCSMVWSMLYSQYFLFLFVGWTLFVFSAINLVGAAYRFVTKEDQTENKAWKFIKMFLFGLSFALWYFLVFVVAPLSLLT